MDLVRENRGLIIFEGILFLILGIAAIALPVVFTFGVEQLIGWLFVIGGIIQAYRCYRFWGSTSFWTTLLSSILSLIIGILLITKPLAGIITLTLLLTCYFIIEGFCKIALSITLKDMSGWGWLLFSGLISIALGALIISGWPGTALWVMGLLVGINMLFFGCSLLSLAWSTPK